MILTLLGWIGTLMVIGAYALVAMEHIKGDSVAVRLLNLIGPICIAIPAAIAGLWNVAALQGVWFMITLLAVFKKPTKKKPDKLSP